VTLNSWAVVYIVNLNVHVEGLCPSLTCSRSSCWFLQDQYATIIRDHYALKHHGGSNMITSLKRVAEAPRWFQSSSKARGLFVVYPPEIPPKCWRHRRVCDDQPDSESSLNSRWTSTTWRRFWLSGKNVLHNTSKTWLYCHKSMNVQ